MIIYLELKSYFPIKESIENLFAFVFSPLFIVEDVEGITGEGREMFGEGRELVGEGEEGWAGGETAAEEKLERSASSTNF